MKFGIAFLCLVAYSGPAFAQYGVSNQRDMYGNIARNSGTISPGAINQGPVNNGPIRNSPTRPPTANAGNANTNPVKGAKK
ncbi:hypothetical protein [Bradyrhizobium sp.]|uniref:hypothetical protein n=1 Tax=Bradyrhizobium sp. TaxID=376 RepID=UPI0025BC883D|nr:hypothetical protein [Bradyrhizobium sp.]